MPELSKVVHGELLDLRHGGRWLTIGGLSTDLMVQALAPEAEPVLIELVAKHGLMSPPITGNAHRISLPPIIDAALLEDRLASARDA